MTDLDPSCAARSAGSRGCHSCWSPVTTTARSRRSWRTRPRPCRCRSRSRPSARSPRCRRPPSRSSPAGRCATWPRCPGCPARCTWSAATAPSSTSASSSGSPPSWSSCAPGCWTSCSAIVAGPARRTAGEQAGQRRGAHPRRRPGRGRRGAVDAVRSGPATWPDITRHPGQGGHRAVGDRHPQGHRDRRSCAPSCRPARCSSSATTSPTRTPSPTCTAPTSASRSGRARPRRSYRVAEPLEAARVLGLLLETRRHWLFGERAVPIERHSMLANGRTRRAAHARRQGDLAVPPAPGLVGDLRRPARRRARPGTSRSRPTGAACRWASATGPAR